MTQENDFYEELEEVINKSKAENLSTEDLKEGEVYAIDDKDYDLSCAFNVTADYQLQLSENNNPVLPAASIVLGYDGLYNFNKPYLFLVKYLGNGTFEDIQSGAIITSIDNFNKKNELNFDVDFDANNIVIPADFSKVSEAIKRYQLLYGENGLNVYSLSDNLGSQLKLLYAKYVLADSEECERRKKFIEDMQKNGLKAEQLKTRDVYMSRSVMNKLQAEAEVDNFIYNQTHKTGKTK